MIQKFVLTTQKLTDSHTAKYLSEVFNDIINEWKNQKKCCVIVTDCGGNIKATRRLLNIDHVSCTAHLLNNIVMNS